MHYLYYGAIKKSKEINTPKKAKDEVNNILDSNSFASSEGGYWGGSKADWYVMGGRWSGHLQEIQLDKWSEKAQALIAKDKPEGEKKWISIADTDKYAKELQALWEELGGTGTNTYNRDQYRYSGSDDDSVLLDEKLYKALLKDSKKDKEEEVEIAVMNEGYVDEETTIRNFLKMKDIIGNYYIVVVDYHN